MWSKLTEKQKKIASTVAAIACTAFALTVVASQFMGPSPASESRRRTLIDAASGEVFPEFRIPDVGKFPYKNPKTGDNTLYPAEACFWTRDGKAKLEPTYVLLNDYVGKSGPTICPDCGKKVVPHNPMPPVELMAAAIQAEG